MSAEATECTTCSKKFTASRRRHHCRNCGESICGDCSKGQLPTSRGLRRACDTCIYHHDANMAVGADIKSTRLIAGDSWQRLPASKNTDGQTEIWLTQPQAEKLVRLADEGGAVVIPMGVTHISQKAFYGCAELVSVVLPSSVVHIGRAAFAGCTRLADIPSGITHIGNYAFDGCTGLVSVVIPSSVVHIGNGAFYGCTGLTSINIRSGAAHIGNGAFYGCTELDSVVIPSSVTHIGQSAFHNCTGLIKVVVSSGVTHIERQAFYGCTGLTSVVIPSSVTHISNGAFVGCTGLASIVVPNDAVIGEPGAFIEPGAYDGAFDSSTAVHFPVLERTRSDLPTAASVPASRHLRFSDMRRTAEEEASEKEASWQAATQDLERVKWEKFLSDNGLGDHIKQFREDIGVDSIEDLEFIEQTDLQEIGIPQSKIKLFLRAVSHLKLTSPVSPPKQLPSQASSLDRLSNLEHAVGLPTSKDSMIGRLDALEAIVIGAESGSAQQQGTVDAPTRISIIESAMGLSQPSETIPRVSLTW